MGKLCALLLLFTTSVFANGFPQQWYLFTDDEVRLYLLQTGNLKAPAKTVLVLHGGFGAEHSYLLPAIALLDQANRYVLYDQRGSLRSPTSSEKISLASMVEDIERIRIELNQEKLVLLAHSMGSALTYAYVGKYPERVDHAVLIGPTFPFAGTSEPDSTMFQVLGLDLEKDAAQINTISQVYRDAYANMEKRAQQLREQLNHSAPLTGGLQSTRDWLITFASFNLAKLENLPQMLGGQAFYTPDVYTAVRAQLGDSEQWLDWWQPHADTVTRHANKFSFVIGKEDFIDPGFRMWPLLQPKLGNPAMIALDDAGHNAWIDSPAAFASAVNQAIAKRTSR